MIGWDEEISVNAKAEHCYNKAVDLDQCQQWIPQIQSIEKHFDGDITQGSQWQETRKEGKRVHSMTLEVFESHSPKQGTAPYVHCAGADLKSMKSYYRFIFTDTADNQCTIRLEARVEPKNFIMKLMGKMMVKFMRKSEAGLMERLKAFCEQQIDAESGRGFSLEKHFMCNSRMKTPPPGFSC